MKLDQLFFTRIIFFISFVCLAYIVSEFSQQKDTFNYLESIFKYEEDNMSIFSRVYFFTGFITYLDGLTSLNGVQVMHLFIIFIIGIFLSRLINTPLEGVFLLTLSLSPLISDNYRGVIRQGFGFSLILIGLLTDKKFIRYALFSAGLFIHNILILPLAAVLVSFSFQKVANLTNLKDSQKTPLYFLFSFIACLFIFMAIYLQTISSTNLATAGIDTAKSGLDFVFFLGFLSLMFIFSGLHKYKWFYESVFFLFIFLTTYFLLTGSARLFNGWNAFHNNVHTKYKRTRN